MEDRIPTKPNRYAVYDDNHNFLRYEYHERADEPTQEGDALNKANLLPDEVTTLLRLDNMENPQVKDALISLALGSGKYGFLFTVLFSNGVPASNVTISGVTAMNGEPCITDSEGRAIGVSTTPTITADTGLAKCIDVVDGARVTVSAGADLLTHVPMMINLVPSMSTISITSSKTFMFSHFVDTADFSAVGGGAGAGRTVPGGGGFVANEMGVVVDSEREYSAIIAAGGAANNDSDASVPGGSSSVKVLNPATTIVSAAGGAKGSANGEGADPNVEGDAGKPGSGYIFNDPSKPVGGGGGKGGTKGFQGEVISPPTSGGHPYGGNGSFYMSESGRGPGGGGATAGRDPSVYHGGGSGFPGRVYIRVRYKA